MEKRYFRRLALLGAAGFLGIWNNSPLAHGYVMNLDGAVAGSQYQKYELNFRSKDSDNIQSQGFPTQISADYIEYNQNDGGFSASGRVFVLRGMESLRTEVILGNAQNGEIFFPERLLINQPQSIFDIAEGHYNFNLEKGEFLNAKGQVQLRYFTGEKIILTPNQIEIQNARMAKDISLLENGKNPAISMRSSRTVIVPNEKMTVYKPEIYIGPHRILRLPTYTTSLKPEDQQSQILFPKIGYDSDLGAYITYSQPFTLPGNAYGNLKVGYYDKADFKYYLQTAKSTKLGSFNLDYGKQYSSDNDVWIYKQPEFTYQTPAFPLGKSKFYIYGFGLAGHWKEGTLSSPRYEAESWLIHQPIAIDDQTYISFGAGIRYVAETAYDNDFSQLRGYFLLERQFTPNFYGSLSIEGNSESKAYFLYRNTGLSNLIRPYITYKLDNRNQFQAGLQYNIDSGETNEIKLGWIYDFRGFQLEFTYTRDWKAKENDYEFKVHTRMF